jgi:hypothetical protein
MWHACTSLVGIVLMALLGTHQANASDRIPVAPMESHNPRNMARLLRSSPKQHNARRYDGDLAQVQGLLAVGPSVLGSGIAGDRHFSQSGTCHPDDTQQLLAELYQLDVLGTRAFLTHAFREGDLLAFTQFLETDAFEAR